MSSLTQTYDTAGLIFDRYGPCGVNDLSWELEDLLRRTNPLLPLERVHHECFQAMALHQWAMHGYQRLLLPPTTIAGLMATSVSREALDAVSPPWPAFSIDIPAGLMPITGSDGQELYVELLVVHCVKLPDGDTRWTYLAQASPVTLWQTNVTSALFFDADWDDGKASPLESRGGEVEETDRDFRLRKVIRRLIIGTCLLLASYNASEVRAGTHIRKPKRGLPQTTIIRIGKPMQTDMRTAVRSYVVNGGKRSAPTVQVAVVGHWKNQPHGPKNTLRRMQWIQPYWRGPEDAPILMHPSRTVRTGDSR